MLISPLTIFSQIRRGVSTTEGLSESISPISVVEIILGFIMFLMAKVQKVITSQSNESEMRITLHYTQTHNVHLSDCGGPVLCTSATRLRKDKLTFDSEGGNESEIYGDCGVTTPPGTFSPCLPVTNQISLEKYVTG